MNLADVAPEPDPTSGLLVIGLVVMVVIVAIVLFVRLLKR